MLITHWHQNFLDMPLVAKGETSKSRLRTRRRICYILRQRWWLIGEERVKSRKRRQEKMERLRVAQVR